LLVAVLLLGGHDGLPAAGVIAQAPNPLDKLDAKDIPKLERFDWQPKELVGVAAEHFGRHAGIVHGVAYHPGGKHVISGGSNGWVRIWDPATMRLQEVMTTGNAILCLALSKDGKRLAVGTQGGSVVVWDLDDKVRPKLRHTIKVATAPVYAVDLTPPNGNLMAVGVNDTSLQTWDIGATTPKELSSSRVHTGPVFGVAYSPDGKRLASGSGDQTVRLWDVTEKQPKEIVNFMGHEKAVRAVAFTPNDSVLASGSTDGTVRFWDPNGKNDKPLRMVRAHATGVNAVAFTSDSKGMATGGVDMMARTWEMRANDTPRELAALDSHQGAVNSVAFGKPDNSELISGSTDWTARLWFLDGAKKPFERTVSVGHISSIFAVAVAPDGRTLATSAHDATVRLWDVTGTTPKESKVFKGNRNVKALAFSPDSKTLTSASTLGQVKQFDVAAGKELRQFAVPLVNAKKQPIGNCVALSPGGAKVLFGCDDKTLRLWDVAAGKELAKLEGHEASVNTVTFSSDGKRALSGAGEIMRDAKGNPVTKGGKTVYVDPTVRLWDIDKQKVMHTVGTHAAPSGPVLFSADSKHGYSMCNQDATLKHWEVSPARELANTFMKTAIIVPLAVSPDNKRLITRDGSAMVISAWNPVTGARMQSWPLKEHATVATVSADNRYLVVGLWTGVVYVLRLEPAAAKG